MYRFQLGFVQVAALVLLLLGLASGVYLVQNRTDLFPEAAGKTIQIVDINGNTITTTETLEIRVKLTAPWFPEETPIPLPQTVSNSTEEVDAKGQGCKKDSKICPDGSAVGRTGSKCEFAPCREAKCKDDNDNEADCVKRKKSNAIKVSFAEDPDFTRNVQTTIYIVYNETPFFSRYTFSDPKPGKKTLYAKFISVNGAVKKAKPFPAVVRLVKSSIPTPPSSPSPTPSPFCKIGINTFSIGEPCKGGNFKSANYICYDDFAGQLGGDASCKSAEVWWKYASEACEGRSSCKPVTTPKPSCKPRPACLDGNPPCKIAATDDMCPPKIICGGKAGKKCPEGYICKADPQIKDGGGYCVRKKPEICAQVITRACPPEISAWDSPECKDFPTPCDVPEGWRVGKGEKSLQ